MTRGSMVLGAVLAATLACAAEDPLRVVTTTTTLKSIAEAVGGDQVAVTSITAGVTDPHFVEPKPTYMTLLRDADVLCVNGLDLEVGWIQALMDGARNPGVRKGSEGYCDCSAGITPLEVPPAGTTRAEGDVHPYGNPHYHLDPLNAKAIARKMAETFSARRPGAAEGFRKRCEEFCGRIDAALFGEALVEAIGGAKLCRLCEDGELWTYLESESLDGQPLSSLLGGWMAKMAPARGRKIVTYHKHLTYFAHRFGVIVAGCVEPKPGIPPSAADLVALVKTIQEGSIPVVVRMVFHEGKSTELIGAKTGAKVIVVPEHVGGAQGTDDYFKLLDFLTGQIGGAFGA